MNLNFSKFLMVFAIFILLTNNYEVRAQPGTFNKEKYKQLEEKWKREGTTES